MNSANTIKNTTGTQRIAIIGCGNPNRSDDGIGPYIIKTLQKQKLPENVALYDAGTNGMEVIYRIKDIHHLLIIDAKSPEGQPGALYHVPAHILEIRPRKAIICMIFAGIMRFMRQKKSMAMPIPKMSPCCLSKPKRLNWDYR